MSSSLERLKALSGKLEAKLAQKQCVDTTASSSLSDTSTAPQPPMIKKKAQKKASASKGGALEELRRENRSRVATLYEKLGIDAKSPDFEKLFDYKAMNLSGIGLKEEDFGELREGKYIQIIAITYEPDKNGKKKAKNISLGYFGKAENLEEGRKKDIIEFVLRWRYEKAFQNLEHYRGLLTHLLEPIPTPATLF